MEYNSGYGNITVDVLRDEEGPALGGREAGRSTDAVGKMKKISLTTQLTVESDLVTQQLDDELVMLDFESGMYFGLNGVSTRAWQLIRHKGRLVDVLEVLHNEYDVEKETLSTDLLAFAEALRAKGLVRVDATEN